MIEKTLCNKLLTNVYNIIYVIVDKNESSTHSSTPEVKEVNSVQRLKELAAVSQHIA